MTHKNEQIYLALIPVDAQVVFAAKDQCGFFSESDVFLAKDFDAKGISVGDNLFVLGFPIGTYGKSKNLVTARQGTLARASKEVLEEGFFYIDSLVYKTGIGCPVIVKPEAGPDQMKSGGHTAGLIGIVSAYVDWASPYGPGSDNPEPVVSLAKVIPVERVYEIIDDFSASPLSVQKLTT